MKRRKNEWSLGGIGLWLIAAILATVIVCSQTERPPGPPATSVDVDVEVIE